MAILSGIKKFWPYAFTLALIAFFTFLSLFPNLKIDSWIVVLLLFLFWLFSLIDKIKTEKDAEGQQLGWKSLFGQQNAQLTAQSGEITNLRIKLDGHATSFNEWKFEKEAHIELLKRLVDRGVISIEDVYRHFETNDVFLIYCYANSVPQIPRFKHPARFYVEYLENGLKCVRLGSRSHLFVTNTRRIPASLHDVKTLKDFLLVELDGVLRREWDNMIESLNSDKKWKRYYNNYSKLKYNDVLKISLLVIRTKINSNNIGLLDRLILPREFYDVINEVVDLSKISMLPQTKTKVKNFVLDSSIELIFHDLEVTKLEKIKEFEPELKKRLNIIKLFDYLGREDNEIEKSFKQIFPDNLATDYSTLLKKRLREYQNALEKLGINTSS